MFKDKTLLRLHLTIEYDRSRLELNLDPNGTSTLIAMVYSYKDFGVYIDDTFTPTLNFQSAVI